ncbi:hypothetical protein D9611_006840 [Ephemerocybe angulata]|uniref:Uncharacterized protein n=1 Tax=Ephemerocybe angulata TaxID=980116 RepID=A0A8H5EVU3_9AGAR|nr:hypothetical protein D9611_006840 [Tulosesus angulatus]
MYHLSPSTISLNPVFPGHYPATPAKPRPQDLHYDGDNSDAQAAYTDNEGDASAYSDSCTSDSEDIEEFSPEADSLFLSSEGCSIISSIQPHSTVESLVEQDASSSRSTISDASTINRPRPSVLDHTAASSVNFKMSDLPSIRSEVSTTFSGDETVGTSQLHNQAHFPSSLSLDVDLVGLPPPQASGRGVFIDGDNSHYYGIDLSCLSQPDGTNAWTLSLGAGSPFPSISTSDATPQSGLSSTFSSPNVSTSTQTTHEAFEASSRGSSPSLSLDYYGMDSTLPTPAYRTDAHFEREDSDYGEPSPPYEPSSLILESVPYSQHVPGPAMADEPKRHFKEVIGDVRKFGSKLKKIWKARPQLVLSQFKTKTVPISSDVQLVEPRIETLPTTPTYASVPVRRSLDGPRGDYSWRTPPGLAQLVEEEEEDLVAEEAEAEEATPRISESRRKLFKPPTMAEIKHIRRRTLPAIPSPVEDPASSGRTSPIINISQRRPRPRSLVFTTSAAESSRAPLDTSYASSTRSTRYDSGQLQYPEVLGEGSPVVDVASARRRKRWSTPFSFLSRS